MTGFQSISATMPDALDVLARHLSQGGESTSPLGLLTSGYDQSSLAKHPSLCGQSGLTMLHPESMVAAAQFGSASALSLFASMSNGAGIASAAEVRKAVASAGLLARIYAELRKLNLPSPMSLAMQMRNVLNELDEHLHFEELSLEELASDHNYYAEEVGTVAALWNFLMPSVRQRRMETLERFAKALNGPVGILHWGKLTYTLEKFLQSCASYQPTLAVQANLPSQAQKLDDLWNPQIPDADPYDGPPVDTYHSETLEEAAQAAAAQIGQWLEEKPDLPIGLIGYSRQMVRRMHSLLGQQQILIRDNTGWFGNNLLVGKALLALASGSSDATKLAQNLAHVLAHEDCNAKWWEMPRQLASHTYTAKNKDRHQQLLDQLSSIFSSQAFTPSEWFARLVEATQHDPLKDYFRNDPAGMGICTTLRMLSEEFENLAFPSNQRMSSGEISRLLTDTLCSTRYMVDKVNSQIELISPANLSSKSYHAVLLLGADAQTLPQVNYQRLFNESIRKQTGLPTRDEIIARRRHAAALLLGDNQRIMAVWSGENAISPYLNLMRTKPLAPLPKPWDEHTNARPLMEGRAAELGKLPETISASACSDLLRCPYMFHAKKSLGLHKDRRNETGQRVNFGTFVHIVLHAMHQELINDPEMNIKKRLGELNSQAIAPSLGPGFDEQLGKLSLHDRTLFALEFSNFLHSYADALSEHLKNYRVVQAEENVQEMVMVGTHEIAVTAKWDRKDSQIGSSPRKEAVIDIKTGSKFTYKDAQEYPQLPIYLALAKSENVDDSSYWILDLSVGSCKLEKLIPKNLNQELVDNVLFDIGGLLKNAWKDKTPMPANGISNACNFCDHQGMCRKEHWLRKEELV